MKTIIQQAQKSDWKSITGLLSAAKLPIEDLNPELDNYFIATAGGTIIGVIGMDRYGCNGLLRSTAVEPAYRNTGTGNELVAHVLKDAVAQGIESLYLITNTAEAYFARKGFARINREQVPADLLQSKEFNGLCPSSAAVMHRKL